MKIKQVTSLSLEETDIYRAILYYLENKYLFSGTVTTFAFDSKKMECLVEIYLEKQEEGNEYFPFAKKNEENDGNKKILLKEEELKNGNDLNENGIKENLVEKVNFSTDEEEF